MPYGALSPELHFSTRADEGPFYEGMNMNSHDAQVKLTLAEALMLDPAQLEGLRGCDLELSADERKATPRLWVHLTGVAIGTRLEAIAGIEALDDGELFVMLNTPARTFVDWLRREDWEDFAVTDATGGDAWAWAALERGRAMCAAMGPLASQLAMRLPAVA